MGLTSLFSRLSCAQAEQGIFPRLLAKRTRNGVPLTAMGALFSIHLLTFSSVLFGLASLQQLVAIADGFFLCNALFGIFAAFRLIKVGWVRIIAILLAVCFAGMLLFSNIWVLSLILLMIGWTGMSYMQKRKEMLFSSSSHLGKL